MLQCIQMPSLDQQRSLNLIQLLLALIHTDMLPVLDLIWVIKQRLYLFIQPHGLYQVFEHQVHLDLRDSGGHEALYSKRQKVRFLQDNVIAYQDQAWGDGDIFADYACSPGIPVDRYREGHRYRILISLRETKNRGDEATIHITRTIRNGFRKAIEELQTEIEHSMRSMSLTVTFPHDRLPRQITCIEQMRKRSKPLALQHYQELPDGRQQVMWTVPQPRLHEFYILRWEW